MKATETLHDEGQSLWLDNITRDLLESGTLVRYIDELSVTGLTSNPTIFDHAIKNSSAYDAAIRKKVREGKSGEELFFDLALEDLTRAADLFRPIWDRTHGVDGWVSLEVSPLLAHDTASTLAAAKTLHARAGRPNLLIKIPGTKEGLPAIEEAVFAGIPINVTLLFSSAHYLAAADAFMRGIERRVAAGLEAEVGSVASVFISRWDAAVKDRVPQALRNQLGIAIAKRTYKAYRALLGSPRWQRVFNAGARPQRLLWASTGTKDPGASDVLYVRALAAPFTVNTMPEGTLKALADHGSLGEMLTADAGWKYDAVSIGYPGPVLHGRPVAEPHNLGPGWVGFDYRTAFGCPVKLVNDAALQARGSYQGGKMLFLGLGTGLGSTLIVEGIVEPMELGHLPYRDGTFETYVGLRGLQEHGLTQWRRDVADAVRRLIAALEPEDVVLGGGNVHQLDELPPGCRVGDNANAFLGGFRLWEESQDGQIGSEEGTGRSMTRMLPLTARPAWKALQAHYEKIRDFHLRTLFADDAKRGERLTAEAVGVFLDYSKNRVTDDTLALLRRLAEECGLRERIDAMFRGDKINVTEARAVLHVALRAPRGASIIVDGKNVVPEVHAVLDAMADFATRVRSGAWKGHTGKRIRNVVNIGIGGSDLGPVMAYEALKHYSDRAMAFRFVSNVDGTDFVEATRDLDPAETLFIVSSKTFTTLETMTNARSARDWSLQGLGEAGGVERPA